MAELFKDIELKKKNGGETVKGEEALKGKLVALYFSAHWCPPCRGFTPLLKDFYNEVNGTEEFEIVFVSFDRIEQDLKNYLEESHGDWLYVPFGSDQIQKLGNQFNVSGIPALIVIKPNGTVITSDARSDVQSKPPKAAFSAWKADL